MHSATEMLECAQYKDLPPTSTSVDHKKRAEDEYSDNFPNKLLELCYIDESRHSMYKEPKIDYERKLSWAKSLGFDPLADGFDPTVPAPPELSSWLYLFYSYLQLEEAYSETLDWLNFTGKRLIDPEPPSKPFIKEVQEIWKVFVESFKTPHNTPYSNGIRRKRRF